MQVTDTECLCGNQQLSFSWQLFIVTEIVILNEMKCDKCNNGASCPMRVSIARQHAEERGEIEPRKKDEVPIDDNDPNLT